MELPELQPWTGASVDADVCVTWVEPCVAVVGDPMQQVLQVAGDGTCLLRVGTQALFSIPPKATYVGVWHDGMINPLLVRAHLYGSVIAILCFLRGMLPMHASCVQLGDAAVLLCGESGAGKSTLAAALARAGHPFLCDDVCAVDLTDPSQPVVWPTFPRVKLMDDAMHLFGLSRGAAKTQAQNGGAKFHYGVVPRQPVTAEPLRIAAVYELATHAESEPVPVEEIFTGSEAFLLVRKHVHRAGMAAVMGRLSQVFSQTALLARHCTTMRLSRPRDLNRLGETVALLEAHHGASPALAHEWHEISA